MLKFFDVSRPGWNERHKCDPNTVRMLVCYEGDAENGQVTLSLAPDANLASLQLRGSRASEGPSDRLSSLTIHRPSRRNPEQRRNAEALHGHRQLRRLISCHGHTEHEPEIITEHQHAPSPRVTVHHTSAHHRHQSSHLLRVCGLVVMEWPVMTMMPLDLSHQHNKHFFEFVFSRPQRF